MPVETFIEKNFSAGSREIIASAIAIIDEYNAQGFTLTLRQLYYQFVARGLIANKQTEYKRIGSIVNDARLAGLIDWEAIEDRTRFLRSNSHWDSPASIIRSAAAGFAVDKWADQPHRVEVWIEKDALVGVIEPACIDLDVPYFACRGYSSQSEQWRAGRRFQDYGFDNQEVVVLHFGDHDPSGIDMTRDNRDRLNMFSGGNVTVVRLALNMDQVDEYNPPPNPAKLTDSRAMNYIDNYGDQSWELDALEPATIDKLIHDNVAKFRDDDLWRTAVAKETEAQELLTRCGDQWLEVVEFLGGP